MKLIIAGSRHFRDYNYVKECIEDSGLVPSEIISGGATGVDSLAIRYATDMNILLTVVEANWITNGKAAGPIRNKKMAELGDILLAIRTNGKGTQNMIKEMRKLKKRVIIYD